MINHYVIITAHISLLITVVQRAAQQLPAERRHQEARDPIARGSSGGQPPKDVDLREVLQRGHQDPLQKETPLLLHQQDERAQSLLGQVRTP